ncbi:MAG: cytochrome PufQ [Pseudomonadota bacterium]
MTDHSLTPTKATDARAYAPRTRRTPAAPRREFYAYFAIIFLATLPLAFVTWTLSALRQMRLPEKGPLAKAWSQARIITPMIFTA